MNGVRRFLGGGSTPSQTPSPQPPLPSTPPPPESPSQTPNSSFTSPKTNGTPGLNFIRKDRQKQPSGASPLGEDDSRSSSQSGQSGSILSPVLSPTRSQTTASVSSLSRKPPPKDFPPVNSPVAGPSSMSPEPLTRKSTEPGWKRTSRSLNIRDELLMSLLASEAVVDSRECEILSSEEVEELKKEQHILSIRLAAMQKKLNTETKIRDAALSLSRANSSHKKVSKQTEEQLGAAQRKVESAQKELWHISERASDIQRRLLEHRAGVLSFSVYNMEKSLQPRSDSFDADIPGADLYGRASQLSTAFSSSTSRSKFDGAHLFAGHAGALAPPKPRALPSSGDLVALEEKLKAATEALNAANKKQADMVRELSHLRLEKEQIQTTMGMELQSAEETIAALENELPRLEILNSQLEELLQERNLWEQDKAQLAEKVQEVERLEGRLEMLEEQSGEASENWESVQEDLENQVRIQREKHEAIVCELERLRQERDAARTQVRILDERVEEQAVELSLVAQMPMGPPIEYTGEAGELVSQLQSVWAILPALEARATKAGAHQNFRTTSPNLSANGSKPIVASLSDMDVRSLKMLYDSRASTNDSAGRGKFTMEAFVARVQALVADDRALIERLIRFAQAHDLLKKNAERAQKLALDSNSALETYQRQVITLENQNLAFASKEASLSEEIQRLHEAIDRAIAAKRDIETHAADQAETCRQLTEANNALSAKALILAQEAASAPEMVRKQLEAQLVECKAALQRAQGELDRLHSSEQTQRVALLDELNSMQTENANLRAQLRALKK